MIELFVDQASTYASDIDGLITLIAVLVGFWFIVTEGVFLWLIFRFRHKEGVKAEYISGKNPKHKRWINIPHALVLICDIFIIVGAIRVWVEVKQTLPEPDAIVRVTGQQWSWTFQHPGADRELDTADDIFTTDDLHVQVGLTYHYELQSLDVLHSFSVPVFRLKQDAVPGRTITGWFKATREGDYDIQCAEMCGIGHGIMTARLHIEGMAEHAAWNVSAAAVASSAGGER